LRGAACAAHAPPSISALCTYAALIMNYQPAIVVDSIALAFIHTSSISRFSTSNVYNAIIYRVSALLFGEPTI
jgi:hypothetical protein